MQRKLDKREPFEGILCIRERADDRSQNLEKSCMRGNGNAVTSKSDGGVFIIIGPCARRSCLIFFLRFFFVVGRVLQEIRRRVTRRADSQGPEAANGEVVNLACEHCPLVT